MKLASHGINNLLFAVDNEDFFGKLLVFPFSVSMARVLTVKTFV